MLELLGKNKKAIGAALAVLGPVVGGGILAGKIDPTDGDLGTLAAAVAVMATLASGLVLALLGAGGKAPPPPGVAASA